MKTCLLALFTLLVPFPALAVQLASGEWFFDGDPGRGAGTAFAVPATVSGTATVSIPPSVLNGLDTGFHLLGVRVQDDDGEWGHVVWRAIYKLEEPVGEFRHLATGEWFIDVDPGAGNGTSFAVPDAASASLSPQVSQGTMNGLSSGFHLLGVRFRDDMNRWGPVVWRAIYKLEESTEPRHLAEGEWFIDADPGAGNGTAFTTPDAAAASLSPQISVGTMDGLSDGFHLLGVRIRDDLNRWGPIVWRAFHLDRLMGVTPEIASLEYRFYDNGSLLTSGTGAINPASVSVETTLEQGLGAFTLGTNYVLEVYPVDVFGQRGHSAFVPFTYEIYNPVIDGAVDTAGLFYTLGGGTNWFAQTTTTHDGIDAAQSGAIGHSQESWFETTVTGPGNLSFWWKVSSENGYDFLEFRINGTLQPGRISGSTDWAQQSYDLPAGSHTLRWRYTKDGSATSGSDAGWVDQIVWATAGSYQAAASAAGLTGDDALPNATPFNDGVENLLKYAFNMNLAGPDVSHLTPGTGSSGLPAISLQGTGASAVFRVEFVRRIGSGLVYTPLKSEDLTSGSWDPLTDTPTITPIDANWERVVYEEPVNTNLTPKCFGAVEVSLP